jgi:hypothetical protein
MEKAFSTSCGNPMKEKATQAMKGSPIMTKKAPQATVDTLAKEKVVEYYVYSSPPKGKAPNNKKLPLGSRSPPPFVKKMSRPMQDGKPAKKMKKLPLLESKSDTKTNFDNGSDGVHYPAFLKKSWLTRCMMNKKKARLLMPKKVRLLNTKRSRLLMSLLEVCKFVVVLQKVENVLY